MIEKDFSIVTPEIEKLADMARLNSRIDPDLYDKYAVKRGLRDINGNGVLTGLTEISEIIAKKPDEEGNLIPCDGELYYRGINIQDLINGFVSEGRFGFEETVYLLLFGKLPSRSELDSFNGIIGYYRSIPQNFVRDIIMKKPSRDIMNALARSAPYLHFIHMMTAPTTQACRMFFVSPYSLLQSFLCLYAIIILHMNIIITAWDFI